MASAPIYIGSVNTSQASVGAGGADGSFAGANLTTVWTAGSNGGQVTKVHCSVAGTSSADLINLYWYDGTNTIYWRSIKILAVTPGTGTIPEVEEYLPPIPVCVPGNWVLKAGSYGGHTTQVQVQGGNY